MKKTIGLLGGIGPESSATFYCRLILSLQEKGLINSNEDYPHIILNSIPAPEVVNNVDLTAYVKGVKLLEDAGASFISIICNTAHLYYDELQKSVNIPVIDLRKEVKDYLETKNIGKVLIVGTSKTEDLKVYDIQKEDIEKKDNETIDKIILDYNAGKSKIEQKKKLLKIIKKYPRVKILSACTEVSLMLEDANIDFLDTMDILREATLREWLSQKLK